MECRSAGRRDITAGEYRIHKTEFYFLLRTFVHINSSIILTIKILIYLIMTKESLLADEYKGGMKNVS